jgi:hypothetical protein
MLMLVTTGLRFSVAMMVVVMMMAVVTVLRTC